MIIIIELLHKLSIHIEQKLGTQALVFFPEGVQADVLPKLKIKAERLAEAQSEPRKVAQLYIERHEKRQQQRQEETVERDTSPARSPNPTTNCKKAKSVSLDYPMDLKLLSIVVPSPMPPTLTYLRITSRFCVH